MAWIGLHPYRALLSLFGRGVVPSVAIAGRRRPTAPTAPEQLRSAMYEWFKKETGLKEDRLSLYRDYELMDQGDIISASLDIYAEDATQVDAVSSKTVWVEAQDKEVEKLGNELLLRIGFEDISTAIARGLSKYGDHFEAILTQLDSRGRPIGVVGLDYRKPGDMLRIEDDLGRLRGFMSQPDICSLGVQERSALSEGMSAPWDYVHFRLLGRRDGESEGIYGTALIRAARRIWRRLTMMEDALTVYRMRRAPDRLKWDVYVADASPEEAAAIINEYRTQLRKKMLINPETGEISTEFDPLCLDEDVFIPVGDETPRTNVEVLRGTTQVGHVLDIDYMRKRLFGCLRIPPDYMGFSDAAGTLSGRSPLSDQDVQFARQEKRIQRSMMVGVILLVKIDLALRGIDPDRKENEFKIRLCPVSFLDEMQRAEVAKVRSGIVGTLLPMGKTLGIDEALWKQYVLKLSGFPEGLVTQGDEEVAAGLALTDDDRKRLAEVLQDRKVPLFLREARLMRETTSMDYPLKFDRVPPALVVRRGGTVVEEKEEGESDG